MSIVKVKVLLRSSQAKQQATCREQLAEAEAQHLQRCRELEERGIQRGGRNFQWLEIWEVGEMLCADRN